MILGYSQKNIKITINDYLTVYTYLDKIMLEL
jgi:hypothetical protein